jgi:hypothetical protein
MAKRYIAISALTGTPTTVVSIPTGTALKTLMQITANAGVADTLVEWGVSFNGTTSTATPGIIQLQRQTTAGTNTTGGGASQINKVSGAGSSPTPNTTAQIGPTAAWSTEPTASDIVGGPYQISPTSGMLLQYPLGREVDLDAGTRLAIVVTLAASVNAIPYMIFEE